MLPSSMCVLRLQALYATDQKELLDSVQGPDRYHEVHRKWHPVYRSLLYDRNYYDIFVFDLNGDMVYSVYKKMDYATNFAQDGPGQWKTSGLGDAYRAAIANPDVVSYVDWRPYGPSAGALAAFLSTGIRDNNANLIGVYSTQLPPIDLDLSTKNTYDTMEKALKLFIHDANSCNLLLNINNKAWLQVITEVNLARTIAMKSARIYFQLAVLNKGEGDMVIAKLVAQYLLKAIDPTLCHTLFSFCHI